jgi:indole-3-glycerol phosphate synthase
MTVLDRILATKRDEITVLHRPQTRALLRGQALDAPPVRDFAAALRRTDGHPGLVAEIKRRSPSKGDLAPDLDPAATARSYGDGGAACLSVLTDGPHFGGSPEDLQAARAAVEVPVLRKDFTVDARDVCDARLMGADAVLLIVAALDDGELRGFHELAVELGLDVLVEVHDESEVERALAAGASVIGVNQRDLHSFEVDQERAVRVARAMPDHVVRVAESGVRGVDDARSLAAAGFDAVLVGESVVTAGDRATTVAGLRVPRR